MTLKSTTKTLIESYSSITLCIVGLVYYASVPSYESAVIAIALILVRGVEVYRQAKSIDELTELFLIMADEARKSYEQSEESFRDALLEIDKAVQKFDDRIDLFANHVNPILMKLGMGTIDPKNFQTD